MSPMRARVSASSCGSGWGTTLGLHRKLTHHSFECPRWMKRSSHSLSIRKGAELMRRIRRRVPGAAFPRYTLWHLTGKQDIPLEPEGTPTFVYTQDEVGNPIVRFLNWKKEWVTYPDVAEPSH